MHLLLIIVTGLLFNGRQVRTQISLSREEELSEKHSQRQRPWFAKLMGKTQVSAIVTVAGRGWRVPHTGRHSRRFLLVTMPPN